MSDGAEDEGRLVAHYWRYTLEVRGADRAMRLVHEARADEASRASDQVDEVVRTGGPHALRLLVRIAASAPDEDALCSFAAGPLEDWMERVAEDDLALAAEQARREPRFGEATRHVWLSEPRRRRWEGLTGHAGGTAGRDRAPRGEPPPPWRALPPGARVEP